MTEISSFAPFRPKHNDPFTSYCADRKSDSSDGNQIEIHFVNLSAYFWNHGLNLFMNRKTLGMFGCKKILREK